MTSPGRAGADGWAPLLCLPGLALLALAWRAGDVGLCAIGGPLLLLGLARLAASEALRRAALPVALILACLLPAPAALHGEVVPLMKQTVARSACLLLELGGQRVRLQGYTLTLPRSELHIIDACSGTRTQVSLLVLAACLLAMRGGPPSVRWGTLLATLPVGWLMSTLRIATTAVAMQGAFWGVKDGTAFHDALSLLVVVPGVLLVWLIHRGLSAWAEARG